MAKKIGVESGLLKISDVNLKYNGCEIEIFQGSNYVTCFPVRTARLKYDGSTKTTNWYQIVPKNN